MFLFKMFSKFDFNLQKTSIQQKKFNYYKKPSWHWNNSLDDEISNFDKYENDISGYEFILESKLPLSLNLLMA